MRRPFLVWCISCSRWPTFNPTLLSQISQIIVHLYRDSQLRNLCGSRTLVMPESSDRSVNRLNFLVISDTSVTPLNGRCTEALGSNYLSHPGGTRMQESTNLNRTNDRLLLPDLTALTSSLDRLERIPLFAGQGACKSCDCPGYKPAKPNYCQCGHHFSQHA